LSSAADETSTVAQPQLLCPICKSREFVAFNGRPNARCSGCLSVERNRLLWMILERYGMFRPGLRVFHIAPELALIRRFSDLSGERYHACDIDPGHYKSRYTVVRPMNLCSDLVKLPSRSFDLILHSHVLEHVRCDPEEVLREMERLLAPGGRHFLCVPVIGEYTREDMSDSLTPEDRAKRFGQSDHYRVFGSISFKEVLDRVWGKSEKHNVEPLELFSAEELERAAIPAAAWTGLTSHTVFHHVRDLNRPVQIAQLEKKKQHSAAATQAPSDARDQSSSARRPQLILHIGAALPLVSRLQQWLTANHYGALRSGLDYWPIAENHSEAMFCAFGNSDRNGKGEALLHRDNGLAPITPEECREHLSDFLSGLEGRAGFVSAEVLWSFGRADVAVIAQYLRERDITTRIVCFVCPPFDQATLLARQRCRTTLALDDFGLALRESLAVDYRRLDRWTSSFGIENVTVLPTENDMIEPFRKFLPTIGIFPPPRTFVESGPTPPPPSMVAVKALLALNQYLRGADGESKKRSRRLREMLTNIKGEAFQFPETGVLRMKPSLQQDAQYLSEKFGVDIDWLLQDCPAVDDPRFFEWSTAEIISLIGTLNDIFSKNEEA